MSAIVRLTNDQKTTLRDLVSSLDGLCMNVLSEQSETPEGVTFWIGEQGDGSVGLPPFEFSPYFPSLEALDNWCRVHRDAVQDEIARDDDTHSLVHLKQE